MKYILIMLLMWFMDYLLKKYSDVCWSTLLIGIGSGAIVMIFGITNALLSVDTMNLLIVAVLEGVSVVALTNIFQWGIRFLLYENMDKILENEELISLLSLVTLALYGMPHAWEGLFSISATIMYLVVLYVGYRYGASAGAIAGAAGGILASLMGSGAVAIGLYCLLGIGVGMFRQAGRILSCLVFVAMGFALAYTFSQEIVGIVELRGIVSAVIIFLAVPGKMVEKIQVDFESQEENPFAREDIKTIANYKMEDFSGAFGRLAKSFSQYGVKKNQIEESELEKMFSQLSAQVCTDCVNCKHCWETNYQDTYDSVHGLLWTACREGSVSLDMVGNEFGERCVRLEDYLFRINEMIYVAQMKIGWNNCMVESREAMSRQMMEVSQMLKMFTSELGSVTEVGRDEKRRVRFRLCGETKHVIGVEPGLMSYEEDVNFKTLTGMARVAKSGERVSGDNFSFLELRTGELLMLLSDGMGSGVLAGEDSRCLVEVLENLLEAGFGKESAVRLLNSLFVMSYAGQTFTTLDMVSMNLYTGEMEVLKNGAAATFIKRGDEVETLYSSALPVGVELEVEPDQKRRQLQDGDIIVMVTDGIIDAFPGEEKEFYIENILVNMGSCNPSDIANRILMQALERGERMASDDMSVLVAGIWEKTGRV